MSAAPPIDLDALSERLFQEIQHSRKYRSVDLPAETIRSLVAAESLRFTSAKEIAQSVREKLHHIVAPYLGDPDYAAAGAELSQLPAGFSAELEAFCLRLLGEHASTRERIPVLREVYQRLWAITGVPDSLLDLACGLHPFGLPWMGLPAGTRYYAYDLHQRRVDLLNQFFAHCGTEGRAVYGDILVEPPQEPAKVAFFFKEAHRFEQRQRGCNRAFWQALPVEWLLVSLPAKNLTGTHSLRDRQQRLIDQTLTGLDWPVVELQIQQELFFCIHKA